MSDDEIPEVVTRICENPDYYVALEKALVLHPEKGQSPFRSRITGVSETDDGNYIIRTDRCDVEVFVYAGFVRWGYKVKGVRTGIAYAAEVVDDV